MLIKDNTLHEYFVITAMLLALLLYSFVPQYIWYWITSDLLDGRWVCGMLENGASQLTSGVAPLAGIAGRFVWTASAFVLLLVLISVAIVSSYVLLSILKNKRKLVGIVVTVFLIGAVVLTIYSVEPDYKKYMQVIISNHECALVNPKLMVFDFIRYLLVVMQPSASSETLNIVATLEQFLPIFVFVCNVLLIAALICLVLYNQKQSMSTEVLMSRFAYFRILLLLGSATFTVIALYHMSQYGWLAQIFQAYKNPSVESLRQIQTGVTLYIGTINSIAIVLLFFPPGWILWKRAQRLSQIELPEQSLQVRSDWLKEKQMTLFAGPAIRIIVAVAPLLVSGALMLLQKALI